MKHIWGRNPIYGCRQGSLLGKVEVYQCNNCYAVKVVYNYAAIETGLAIDVSNIIEPPLESCGLTPWEDCTTPGMHCNNPRCSRPECNPQ